MIRKSSKISLLHYFFASLVPILLLAFWLSSYVTKLTQEIEKTEREIIGTREISRIYELVTIAQKLRDLRMILQEKDQELIQKEITSLQKFLVREVDVHAREDHADWMGNRAEFESAGREIRRLNQLKTRDLPGLFQDYTQQIDRLLTIIELAGQNSHLVHDAELESYHLMDLVVRRLPRLTEDLASLRGLSVYAPVNEKEMAQKAFRIRHLIALVRNELDDIVRSKITLPGYMIGHKDGGSILLSLSRKTYFYLNGLEVLPVQQMHRQDSLKLFNKGSNAVNSVGDLYSLVIRSLKNVLKQRLNQQARERNLVMLVGILGLMLILLAMFWFYRINQKAHAELVGTSNLVSTVLNTMIDAMILIDKKGTILSFNRAAEETFLYKADEVIGKNVNILMPEPFHSEHDQYLSRYLSEGGPRIIGIGREVTAKRKNGDTFPAELGVNEVLVDERRVFSGVVRDITERKQYEGGLKKTVSSLQHLHDITSDAVSGFQRKMKKLLEMGREVFKMDLAILSHIEGERYIVEYIAGPEGAPVPGDEFDFAETYCFHTYQADGPTAFHHAGESHICTHPCYINFGLESYIGAPIYVDGQRYGTLNFSSPAPREEEFSQYDLSLIQLFAQWVGSEMSRLRVEESLKQFKSTLDQTMDCVFMFEPKDLRFIYVNQGAMQQVGYSYGELMRMTPYDIKPEHDENSFRKMIQQFLDGEINSMNFETIHEAKDGTQIPVEIFLQYIAPENEPARFVAVVRDITERKKVDRMKNEFVSTVSHELRTPLTSIRGSLGLITGGGMGEIPEQLQSLLTIAQNNTERLLLLINDILDIQKIESGHMSFDFKPVDLSSLVRKAVNDNSSYAEQYKVRFITENIVDGIHVHADASRLLQVMGNLLSNAAKFSPEGDFIEVSMAHNDGVTRVSVSDHGPGIPEEFHAKLFDKFTQYDSADNRKAGGTGLGLSISKAIIERHGGKIGFVTDANIGTTFFIELPVLNSVEWKDELIGYPDKSKSIPAGNRILVVEDDHDIAALIRKMLAEAGFDSDIAYDARDARVLLGENPGQYAAMTLDLLLPDDNGISLIQELREQEVTEKLPIVVVSCVADNAKRELKGISAGVVDWLSKPIDQERLVRAVRSATDAQKVRVLHLEDEQDVQQIVKRMLKDVAEVESVDSLEQARQSLQNSSFDIVLLDIGLPVGSGLDLLDDIKKLTPQPRVVIFSAQEVAPEILQQVNAVMLKSTTSNAGLVETIVSVLSS